MCLADEAEMALILPIPSLVQFFAIFITGSKSSPNSSLKETGSHTFCGLLLVKNILRAAKNTPTSVKGTFSNFVCLRCEMSATLSVSKIHSTYYKKSV
jgi:hypothetical protein